MALVTLYVREAHPGENYPQTQTFEQKLDHARAYEQRDQIPWTIAVDDLEGSLHRALDPKPNPAHIMDKHGNVAFRALWSNDEAILRDGLESILAGRSAGEREPHLVRMIKGLVRSARPGSLWLLERAGWRANQTSRQGVQIRVSGLKTAQANQKWLPLTIGRRRLPASGPPVARPRMSQVESV